MTYSKDDVRDRLSDAPSQFRKLPGATVAAIRNGGAFAVAVLAFVWDQLAAAGENIVAFVTWIQLDYVLPPGIVDLIQWVLDIVPQALGLRGSRNRQIASASVIAVVAFVSTVLTGGLLIAVYLVAALLVLFGFTRMLPWINRQWTAVRDEVPGYRDGNVPLWSRD